MDIPQTKFTLQEQELIVLLAGAGGCSLDSSAGTNWVQNNGGLPTYICQIARALLRSGHPKSQAIAIAVSRAKHWAAGGSTNSRGGKKVHTDTQAKAAAAVAQWEALKAKDHAKSAAKETRAALSHDDSGEPYIFLANSTTSYNTAIVADAWGDVQRARRIQSEADGTYPDYDNSAEGTGYIEELWTDHLIICGWNAEGANVYWSVPYTVDNGQVSFGAFQPVEKTYTPVAKASIDSDYDGSTDLGDNEYDLLSDVLGDDNSVGLTNILKLKKG